MQFSSKSGWPRPGVLQETVPTPMNKTGSWRFLTPVFQESNAPCRLACPLESGIPHWLNKVRQGDLQGAWQVMQVYNPFPAITGQVCYRFCEEKCHRASWDEAVAVREVEKAVGLWRHKNYRTDKTGQNGRLKELAGKKVAIVGSGPAGLSCAYYLRQSGAAVTIFEKLPLAGGLLATGIPDYRLPRDILAKELKILEAEGVNFRTGREVGQEISLPELQAQFDAVLLAVGAQQSRRLQVKGEKLPGVSGALEFLGDLHTGRRKAVAGQVVVAGGGNAAVDAACMAKLRGAREVSLLYRRSREEMPAHPEEIEAAAAAGVNFVFETVLQEICGEARVEKVCALHTAPSRRGEPLQVLPETAFELQCDLLIVAAGQESNLPALDPALQNAVQQANKKNPARGSLNLENKLFAAGDALTGPASVAAAIFGGRQAALQLRQALGEQPGTAAPEPSGRTSGFNRGLLPPAETATPDSAAAFSEQFKTRAAVYPGIAPPLQGPQEAIGYDNLNAFLYPKQGRQVATQQEAGRCFSCGTCSRCGVCWVFCPEPAIKQEPDGSFQILLDYCKGCGICAVECPAGVLSMEEVPGHGT
ncbi:MAG: FAD-dependent oxidoreductase [Firmicutes bacterium]|nr:FAD-dependent oxidoreductase [Bacillota bacterium]